MTDKKTSLLLRKDSFLFVLFSYNQFISCQCPCHITVTGKFCDRGAFLQEFDFFHIREFCQRIYDKGGKQFFCGGTVFEIG